MPHPQIIYPRLDYPDSYEDLSFLDEHLPKILNRQPIKSAKITYVSKLPPL